MIERIRNHRFHRLIGNIDCTVDLYSFFLAGLCIPSEDMKDSVCIDFELDADANTTFGGGLKLKIELTKQPVISRHYPFALQHFEGHLPLVVYRCCKHFSRRCLNRRIAWN